MDISYILIIIFMILILILGIVGIYTKNHPKVIEIINKSWFYQSLKISSVLLILYSITIIFLIIKKVLL
jgi:TRAP-type C4-dicarboxylate transport system permease small subunit